VADRVGDRRCVFLAGLHAAERGIAARLRTLSAGEPPCLKFLLSCWAYVLWEAAFAVTCSPRFQPRISWIRRGAEDDAAEPVH